MTSAEELTQQTQSAGGYVSSYIPDDTLLVVMQASLLSHLQQITGVAWIGDYLPEYKIAPEAQLLSQSLASQSAALLAQQQSVHPPSATPKNHRTHIFLQQTHEGTFFVRIDVSFPHHLPNMLGQLQAALALCDSSNLTREGCHADAVQQQLGSFHPSVAGIVDWQAALSQLCDSQCSFAASGAERITISVPVQHLQVQSLLP